MTEKNDQNIILKWKESNSVSGRLESWFIRGILPDRRFYGEMRLETSESAMMVNVTGTLSVKEYNEIRNLVSDLSEYDQKERLPSGEYDGLIALGPVANPVFILKLTSANCKVSELATKCERIVEIMTPYMTA